MMAKRSIAAIVAGSVVVIGTYFVWSITFPQREAGRWSDCIGKPLSTCNAPPGYFGIDDICPPYLECSTKPAGVRYVSALLDSHRGYVWSSHAYAVIAIDKDDKIVAVEIKRFYAALQGT